MKKFSVSTALLAIALILLAVVDVRRGFLFSAESYFFKNSFVVLSVWHLILLALGFTGLKMTASSLKILSDSENKKLLAGIFILLIGDFILYRGVAMNRSLTAGKIGLDWLKAFGETGFLKSFYLSVSYLFTVWHATFLSCLVGGLGLLAFPRFALFVSKQSHHKSGILGTFYSLTQPFCSCCVAVTAPSLFSTSLPRSFGVSVLLGAPLLNLSTLVLAATLLPWPYAGIRIIGGILVTVVVGLGISFVFSRDNQSCVVPSSLSTTISGNPVAQWFRLSGRLALWLFPSIIAGVMLTSLLWQLWPESFSNSAFSVAVISFFGTLLMISTWSEIPLTLELINHGMSGPAAAALIALPAVNLASLVLIGKSTKQWKLVLVMGLSVMALSFAIGLVFL